MVRGEFVGCISEAQCTTLYQGALRFAYARYLLTCLLQQRAAEDQVGDREVDD